MKAVLKTYKKILVIAGTILIFLISMGALTYILAVDEMEFVHSSMNSTMSTFENKYIRASDIQKTARSLDEESIQVSEYLIRLTCREAKDIQTAIDSLRRDNMDCYFIDASGKISAAKGAASLNLSKPQIDQLINELGSALVEISVGPDEDIEKIRQLIRNSAEWYQSRIPALVDGPWLIDASASGAAGITVCLGGSCAEEIAGSARSSLLTNTAELFRDHGIRLAGTKENETAAVIGQETG